MSAQIWLVYSRGGRGTLLYTQSHFVIEVNDENAKYRLLLAKLLSVDDNGSGKAMR